MWPHQAKSIIGYAFAFWNQLSIFELIAFENLSVNVEPGCKGVAFDEFVKTPISSLLLGAVTYVKFIFDNM